MDEATIGYLSYRWHDICNPFSLEQLERTLALTDLTAGDRACDLGSGNGFVAAWIAARHGLHMTAVERHDTTAGLARAKAAQVLAPGRMQVVQAYSHDYLADAGEHRLVTVLGALEIFPGVFGPADAMKRLAASVAPGGWLLWGDPFWRKKPSPQLNAFYAEERFCDLPGWVKAGEGAGLVPHRVTTTTDAEWETFIWTTCASLEAWADENPASPAAGGLRMRAAMTRNLYLQEVRESVGFGLYLFRRPAT